MEIEIKDLLERGVVNILPSKEDLKKLLNSDKKLNVYHGIDPTATRIHIGHAVSLRKMQKFVDLGHNVTFLIGDFTALIGDTSDKDKERPVLTYEEIQENFKTYKKQAEKLLDFDKVKLRFNSEWLKGLKFADIIKLCQHFSVGDFVGRELIKRRLENGKKVGLHETLYPVMQGYDSFHMDTDVQIGAADQTFNMMAGRTLLKDLANKESYVFVTDYLIGTDGRKMSKSWGNAIWLSDSAEEMFGKVMSLNDDVIVNYYTLATNVPLNEIKTIEKKLKNGENPMNIKMELAYLIVKELHSEKQAQDAKKQFQDTFQNNAPTYEEFSLPKENLISNIISMSTDISMSEAKRLISQNSVDINGKTISDPTHKIKAGDKIKIGKKKFVKITSKE